MTTDEVSQLFAAHPSVALRLTLTSGTVVDVHEPRRAHVSGTLLYINCAEDGTLTLARRSKVVAISCIEMVEPKVPLPRL